MQRTRMLVPCMLYKYFGCRLMEPACRDRRTSQSRWLRVRLRGRVPELLCGCRHQLQACVEAEVAAVPAADGGPEEMAVPKGYCSGIRKDPIEEPSDSMQRRG